MLPGQVVEADVFQRDPGGRHPEQRGEIALEPDGHVAQADRAVPAVSRARVTMPTGLVKSMMKAEAEPDGYPFG